MERRLIVSLFGALALHGALLLRVGLSRVTSATPPAPAPPVSVELLTLREEQPAPPEPPPPEPSEAPPPRAAVAATPPQPAARRTPPAVLAAKGASEASAPEGTPPGEADDASAPAPAPARGSGEGSAAIDLGLDGSVGRWAFQAEQDRARAAVPRDVGGIQSAILADDTARGRGPGFEIAARLLERGRELAPVGSSATAEFCIEPDGSISSASLLDSRSAAGDWRRVLEELRRSLPRVRQAPARRIRARLSLESRGSAPSGKASGPSFDLSNIGAAQQHWFHVRVLAQTLD